GSTLDLAMASAHAAATLRQRPMDVLAVSGPSHEACLEHIELRFVPAARRQILIVTRDPHNAPRLKKQGSILRPITRPTLGDEPSITDTNSSKMHVAFRDLMDSYIAAPTVDSLEEALYSR